MQNLHYKIQKSFNSNREGLFNTTLYQILTYFYDPNSDSPTEYLVVPTKRIFFQIPTYII